MSLSAADVQRYRNAGFTGAQIKVLASMAAVPSDPSVFSVATYGAKGDGRLVLDGAVASGSANLTCAISAPFSKASEGKYVQLPHVATLGVTTWVAKILTYVSPTQVILNANAPSTLSNAMVVMASDDTAAFKAAVAAAHAYALGATDAQGYPTGPAASQVWVPQPTAGCFYGIAGALDHSQKGNAQIPMIANYDAGTTHPNITNHNTRKITIDIAGPWTAAAVQHWEQRFPVFSGACLVSFGLWPDQTTQGNDIGSYGNHSVIGGPTQTSGFGAGGNAGAQFSNMHVSLRNLSIFTPYSRYGWNYSAIDLSGVACATLENISVGAIGAVYGGQDYSANFADLGNGYSIGILLPANGNNDLVYCRNISIHGGFTRGILLTEHAVVDRIMVLYCWAALCPVGTYFNSVGAIHAVHIQQASVEGCQNLMQTMGQGSNGLGPFFDIAQLDTESAAPTFVDRSGDGSLGSARGSVKLVGQYNWAALSAPSRGFAIINGQTAQT